MEIGAAVTGVIQRSVFISETKIEHQRDHQRHRLLALLAVRRSYDGNGEGRLFFFSARFPAIILRLPLR